MRHLFIILTLLLHLFLLQGAALSQRTPQTQAQDSEQNTQQLTLDQIKDRIRIYVAATNQKNKEAIDKAVATEISKRGIRGFQPIPSILNDLRKLGAGPKTIQAIEDLKKRSENIGTQNEAPSHKIIILVADFQGPEIEKSSVTNTIIDELNDATRDYSDVDVIPLNEPITAKQGRKWASEKGKEHNASIILWGWYEIYQGQVLINVHFQVLQSSLELLFSSEKQTLLLPIADFLSFQIRLSKEMIYLTFFTTGFIRFLAGEFADAIDLFTNAIAESNVPQRMVNPADAYLLRSVSHFLQVMVSGGLPDQVFEDLKQVISLKPEDTAAYRLRCSAYSLRNEIDLAMIDCKKAIELEPNEAEGYSSRANLYLQKGDINSAIADIETAIKLGQSNPDDLRMIYYRSVLFRLKGDFDSLISSLSQLIKQDAPPFVLPSFLLLRASAYLEKDLNDLAMADLKRIIEIIPQSSMAYWLLGDVFYNKKDFDLAISNYKQAIKFGLNEAEIYRDLGIAYRANKDISHAIESYSKAIIIDPGYREAYESRASLFMLNNEFDKVIEDYTKAIGLDPKSGYSYLFRGYAHYRKGELDEAFTDYRNAIELMPQNGTAYFYRGIAFEAKNELDKAIDDYGLAAKFNPKDALAHFYRGKLYSRKNNHEQAINEYTQAINIDPNYVIAYLSRGKTYVLKPDHKSAISDLTKVLQLSADPQIRKEAEQILGLLGVK